MDDGRQQGNLQYSVTSQLGRSTLLRKQASSIYTEFHPHDGGSSSFWKAGTYLPTTKHKIPEAHNLQYSDNQLVLTGTTDFIGVITAVIFTIALVWCSDTLEVLAGKLCRTAGLVLGVAELPLIRSITTIIVMVTQPTLPKNVRKFVHIIKKECRNTLRIALKWHQVIAICFQRWSKILVTTNLKVTVKWKQLWHDGWKQTPTDINWELRSLPIIWWILQIDNSTCTVNHRGKQRTQNVCTVNIFCDLSAYSKHSSFISSNPENFTFYMIFHNKNFYEVFLPQVCKVDAQCGPSHLYIHFHFYLPNHLTHHVGIQVAHCWTRSDRLNMYVRHSYKWKDININKLLTHTCFKLHSAKSVSSLCDMRQSNARANKTSGWDNLQHGTEWHKKTGTFEKPNKNWRNTRK